jgi:hypothetical protein
MMELYKKEKINPVAGCWPVLIQIPVFFALYKVLYVTIEMRHAPFFGWIQDLSAPDPTSLFNLFGLLPYDPTPSFLMIGCLADYDGHHHVHPDAAEPDTSGPDPGDDLHLDAGGLHLHAGHLPGRSGDLLDVEQHAFGAAAGCHHETPGRQDRALGQSQGDVHPRRPLAEVPAA